MSGKKTYIVAGVMFAAALAKGLGLLDAGTYEVIMGLLAAMGFGTLRAGVEKTVSECKE